MCTHTMKRRCNKLLQHDPAIFADNENISSLLIWILITRDSYSNLLFVCAIRLESKMQVGRFNQRGDVTLLGEGEF